MSRAAVALLLALQGLPGAALGQAGATPRECAAALDAQARVVGDDRLALAWRSRPQPLPLDRHFELDILVCGQGIDALRVDADMPAHRHGMNYRVRVEDAGGGRRVARGLLFHMPGRWRLIFDVERAGQHVRLTDELDVR